MEIEGVATKIGPLPSRLSLWLGYLCSQPDCSDDARVAAFASLGMQQPLEQNLAATHAKIRNGLHAVQELRRTGTFEEAPTSASAGPRFTMEAQDMGSAVQAHAPRSDLGAGTAAPLKKSMVSAEPRGYRPSDAGTVVSEPHRRPWQSGHDPKAHKMATDYIDGEWKTFWDFVPDKDEPFLFPTDGRRPLSFRELKVFIVDETNDIPGMGREDRLCLVFPTGPELAVAYWYLAFAVRCTVAPLNLYLRADEFDFEYDDLPCKAKGRSSGKILTSKFFFSSRAWWFRKQMAWMPKTKRRCAKKPAARSPSKHDSSLVLRQLP
ncbi:GIP [Symbiodinium sp. CCMP2592]|nr:GIP [Symbiodinium sp. CCMP2592]